MQPNAPTPGPAPLPPHMPSPTQYDFIMNPNQPGAKRPLIGGHNKHRLLMFSIIGGVLLIIILIASSVFFGGNKTTGLLEIAQTQQELIRVSDLGTQKAASSSARALAYTTKESMASSQNEMLGQLAKQGQKKINPKTLAVKKNKHTDEVLAQAALDNRYDETFEKTLQQQLVEYQKLLKATYDKTGDQKLQRILNSDFDSAGLLIASVQPS